MINIMSESLLRLYVKVSQPKPPEEAERPHFLYLLQENSKKLQVFSKILLLFI